MATSVEERFKIISRLKQYDILSMIYYKRPLHMQRVFDDLGYSKDDFPISEKVSDKILSIPMHPYLIKDHQNNVNEVLNNG